MDGRFDLLLIGSYGRVTGMSGGRLALAYRGLPVELSVHGYAGHEPLEFLTRYGGVLRVNDRMRWSLGNLFWWASASALTSIWV